MILKEYSVQELQKQNKKIIAFGSGKLFSQFCEGYYSSVLVPKLFAVIDNSPSKIGSTIYIRNKPIPVIALEQIKQYFPDVLIIITAADVCPIYEQLSEVSCLNDVECCICYGVWDKTERQIDSKRIYPASFKLSSKPLIPKVIHYCWFGKNPLPERYEKWMASWKKFCPDYKIIRWDEESYDISWCPYMKEAYQNKKWGFVSDVARIDVVYKQGGIYLDTDVELIKNLDDLLYQKSFFGVDESLLISTGLGFASAKLNPVLKGLLDLYAQRHFVKENGVLDITACPTVQREYFNSLGYMNDGNLFIGKDFTVYPSSVLAGKSLYTGKLNITSYTYSIHHYDGSWTETEFLERKKNTLALLDSIQG